MSGVEGVVLLGVAQLVIVVGCLKLIKDDACVGHVPLQCLKQQLDGLVRPLL